MGPYIRKIEALMLLRDFLKNCSNKKLFNAVSEIIKSLSETSENEWVWLKNYKPEEKYNKITCLKTEHEFIICFQ